MIHYYRSVLCALLVSGNAFAATIPFTNDFDSTAFPNASSGWTLAGGAYTTSGLNGSTTSRTASIDFTNVDGTSLTMTTQFTVTSGTEPGLNQQNTVGFGLFGGDSAFSGSSEGTAFYLADFVFNAGDNVNEGSLRLLSLGGTNSDFTATNGFADANGGNSNLAVVVGTTYTLRLTATFVSATSLSLELALFDAAGTTQIGTSATASDPTALSGDFFGFRNRFGDVGGSGNTISFEQFSATPVPEPSAIPLFIVCGAMFHILRRRKQG